MTLTPKMIEQFNAISGASIPPPGTPRVTSRAEEIRQIASNSATLADQPKPEGLASRIGSDFKERGSSLIDSAKSTRQDVKNAGGGIGANIAGIGQMTSNVAGAVAGGVVNAGVQAAKSGINALNGDQGQTLDKGLADAGKARNILGQTNEETLSKVGEFLKRGTDALPDNVTHSFKNFMETIGLMGGGKLLETPVSELATGAKSTLSKTVQETKNIISDASSRISESTSGIRNAITEAPMSDMERIQEMISPKPTAAEAKKATMEGRLYKGKDPTLLKKGTGDRIAASDQQLKSTQAISKSIPDAASMSEPELYSAIDHNVSRLAKDLQPKMQATPIGENTVQRITDEWEGLKKSQIAEAKATDEPNISKLQSNFEKYLQKSGSGTMDDLWKTAKEYDASIKANVKNASDLSDEWLQVQKDVWLQNRSILRDAINDSVDGMGDVSRQAFADMHAMYEAQNGILSKAAIEGAGKPSKVSGVVKAIKDHPVAAGAAALGASSLLRK